MRHISYQLKGQPIAIHVLEDPKDVDEFTTWIRQRQLVGFDTEATGLDWWNAGRGFRLRLVQFGTESEAYVIPVELGEPFAQAVRDALSTVEYLVAHNGTYDLHVIEACLGIPMEELAPRMWDTKILAHLVDPRAVKEGGPGLKLEELTKHYICKTTADEVKGSMAVLARQYKTTKGKVWELVDLLDPHFLLYAGMDPVLAYRLFRILYPLVPTRSKVSGLIGWEHRLAHITAKIERTGYLVDEEYAEARVAELRAEEEKWVEVARSWGVENINSDKQLAEAFQRLGYRLTKRTPKGNIAMDSEVLDSIDHPLAEAVKKATKAAKWRKTWFENALNGRDAEGRVRASINSIAARTARMTITGSVPAQTFPAGTGYVRRMFLAEEGHVSVTIDFANMELRFTAAESRDPVMVDAFLSDRDLHQITADAAGVSRKTGKQANFLTVFGGGWKALMANAGVTEEVARKTIDAFNQTYKYVGKLSKKLTAEARRNGYIFTVTGRKLPVDKHRAYSAFSYYIQSGSRDITARAVINLDRAGFTPWIRLIIHDEIVFSFPQERAEELARQAAKIMEFTVKGVVIPAEGEIGDRSWGSILDLEDSKH